MPSFRFPTTKAQKANRATHEGWKKITPGSFISDLAALGKAIMLCDMCVKKWDRRKARYDPQSLWPGQRWAQGDCDGCKKITRIYLFLPEGKRPFEN